MGRTAARLVVGMGLVVFALVAGRGLTGPRASAVAEELSVPVIAEGTVAADGTLVTPVRGAAVERVADGRYLVGVAGSRELHVSAWEAVVHVVVTPVGADATLVRFVDRQGVDVDTGFSFAAS